MNSDAAPNKHEYMKGRDYLNALFAGKYFILIVMVICMALTAIYSYSHIPKNKVFMVIKPGEYMGERGKITPFVKPEGLVSLINQGSFDGLIQRSLRIDPPKPIEFKAVNPDGTDIINVTYETGNASDGLKTLRELLTQLLNYYDKERAVKSQTVSSNYVDSLKLDISTLEVKKVKKTDEKTAMVNDRERLTKRIQDKNKGKTEETAEQIRDIEKEIAKKEKEIVNLSQEIIYLTNQIPIADVISKQKTSLTVIQEPMIISSDFTGKFFNNILVAAVLSLVLGVLIQFVIYDFKMGRR